MTNIQRMENDIATIDRRATEDRNVIDNRIRNDELTRERRFKADRKEILDNKTVDNRNKNDEKTSERRSQTDETLGKNRLKNDKITVHRREVKDGRLNMVLAVSLLTLTVVTSFLIGTFFVLG